MQWLVLLDQRYPSNYTTFGGQNLLSHLWRLENRFLYSRRPTSRCNDFYKKNLRTARQRVKNLLIFLFEISFNTFPLRPSVPSPITHLMTAEAQRAIRRRSARVGKQVPVQPEKKKLFHSPWRRKCVIWADCWLPPFSAQSQRQFSTFKDFSGKKNVSLRIVKRHCRRGQKAIKVGLYSNFGSGCSTLHTPSLPEAENENSDGGQ